MAAGPALPGLFCCFAAMVLLIFVSVSVPTWDKISFLNVPTSNGETRFGVFGYTGSKTQIGYDFNPAIDNFDAGKINTNIIHNLTYVLILYPIAAGISGLAFLFGLCGAGYHRVGTVFMSLLSGLALLVTLVAWVIDMVLFGIVKARLHDQNVDAKWGNANWIGLGAFGALLIGFCASSCGIFGSYRRRREASGTY
ncbi:pali-domain-containing protein [Schizophyllum commune Tattone D]|nr:pali-domain-containing protein [Schizophyllum commune Loenen D]KAI5826423.1 pali-domain-containing protein [Schizophyllum commune Tattone D]